MVILNQNIIKQRHHYSVVSDIKVTEMNLKRRGPPPKPDRKGLGSKRITELEMDRILIAYEKRLESGYQRNEIIDELATKYVRSTRSIERYIQKARRRREHEQLGKILKNIYPEYLKKHYGKLAQVAKKLKDNLCEPILDSLVSQLYPAEHLRFFQIEVPWRFERDRDSNRPTIRFKVEDAEPLLSSCLFSHLEYESSKFATLPAWKEDVGKLIERCHDFVPTIVSELEKKTGLQTSETDEVGLRSSRLAPFVLGWILLHHGDRDTYPDLKEEATGELMELRWEVHGDKIRLALGSAQQVGQCKKAIKDLMDFYTLDNSLKNVIETARGLEERAKIFAQVLDLVIPRQIFQGTCHICIAWVNPQHTM